MTILIQSQQELDDSYFKQFTNIVINGDIEVLHFWQNASYPHKIAFRKGAALYECDIVGRKIERKENRF